MKQGNEISSPAKSTVGGVQRKSAAKPVRTVRGRDARPSSGSAGERQRLIAEAAYYRALARGFVPGCEVDDWLQAEAEVDHVLTRE